jgi:hypothetical protein
MDPQKDTFSLYTHPGQEIAHARPGRVDLSHRTNLQPWRNDLNDTNWEAVWRQLHEKAIAFG